jgi:hypothetical protein
MKKSKKKWIVIAMTGLFTVTGTYNALVMNSESHISGSDVKFVKRLDEIYGKTIYGREVAASVKWQKIAQSQIKPKLIDNVPTFAVSNTQASSEVVETPQQVATVQEELNMNLVEVINPNKYKKGLAEGSFNGSLSTNNGVIESLTVSLPNGEGLSISFSEMTGNVFEYDMNGELYSGMMYQVDQFAYMVTLTGGPLEGTRLRFATQSPEIEQVEVQNALAENNNLDVGAFENEQTIISDNQSKIQAEETFPEQLLDQDKQMQQEASQAQSLNPESLQL